MFRKVISSASSVRRSLREQTIRRGGLFFTLFWGVLCFGGLTLISDLYDDAASSHKTFAASLTVKIVVKHLFMGLFWGSVMWLFVGSDGRRAKKADESKKPDFPN